MILKFRKNIYYNDNRYDLINDAQTDLSWIKLSILRKDIFKNNGANYILESWSNENKILFTGLRKAKETNYYTGDHFNPHTGIKYDLKVKISKDYNDIIIELKQRESTTTGRPSKSLGNTKIDNYV